ncbi:MAG: amidohydrolase family protein [Actinomycetota bacterium]
MLLKQARLTTGEIADVEIEDGVVAAIRTDGSPRSAASRNVHDLDGFLLLPAAADPHAHLDKTSTADVVFNPAGHLGGAIEAWQRHYASLTVADIAGRARRSALAGLLRGYTAIRTHVDVAEGLGLKSVEALLVVREELGKLIDIQVCGLVAVPMTGTAGAGNRAALRVALEMGIDVVGGAPWRDPDQVAALEFLLAEAASFARPIDLHLDETLDPSATLVRDFARLVQATGFAHGATASHCVSLGTQDIDVQQAVAAELAAGGISVIANPFTNLYLQARDRPVSPPRGLTALRELLVAGVNVAAGTDNV